MVLEQRVQLLSFALVIECDVNRLRALLLKQHLALSQLGSALGDQAA